MNFVNLLKPHALQPWATFRRFFAFQSLRQTAKTKKKQQQWGAKNLINCSPVEGKLQHQEQEQEQDQKVLPATGIPLQNSICSSSSSCPFGNHRRRSKSAWPNDFPVMPSLGQRKHNEVGWKEKMVGNLEQNRWEQG